MKTVLIDSNYLCYKAWHTTGGLSYKDKPVGVIFGFLNQLFTIGETLHPDNIVFCWDSKKSIRRHHYPFYKNRPRKADDRDMTDAFIQFKELRKEILPQLGFCNNYMQIGYETDDLIAKIAQTDIQSRFIIVSSDNDFLQLLDSSCIIYNPGENRIITKDDLFTEYGVTPKQWIKVKTIAGCNSDTVPGIKGIGEITAAKYLTGRLKPESKKYQDIKKYGTEALYKRNDWLVRLPLPGTKLPEIKQSGFNRDELVKLCDALGFSHLRNDSTKLDDWNLYFGRKT